VAFWATVVVVVVLVAYPLSFGPACWISSRANVGAGAVTAIYRPITSAMWHNAGIAKTMNWYSEVGAERNWHWVVRSTTPTLKYVWMDPFADELPGF
jgi:hypothetical protein